MQASEMEPMIKIDKGAIFFIVMSYAKTATQILVVVLAICQIRKALM